MISETTKAEWTPRMLSILRIAAALTFMAHGTQKLLGFPASDFAPAAFSLMWFAGVLELFGGAAAGRSAFYTRPVAFVLSGHDGRRLLDGARAAELLPGGERRGRGDPLLLRLPVHRVRRARPLEPRRPAGREPARAAIRA